MKMTDEKLEQAKKAQWKIRTYEEAPRHEGCHPTALIVIMAEFVDLDKYNEWLTAKVAAAKNEFAEL